MSGQSYSNEIQISVNPELVFKAITKDLDKWWTKLSNQALQVGDQLVIQFEKSTSWVMIISEVTLNRFLVWKVTEANHNLESITKKDEWNGTTIKWNIEENERGSRVTLTHQGLIPELECFEICKAGWNYFLGSLKSYLETGNGYPYKITTAE